MEALEKIANIPSAFTLSCAPKNDALRLQFESSVWTGGHTFPNTKVLRFKDIVEPWPELKKKIPMWIKITVGNVELPQEFELKAIPKAKGRLELQLQSAGKLWRKEITAPKIPVDELPTIFSWLNEAAS